MNFLKEFDAFINKNNINDALLEALKFSEIRPYIKEWEEYGGRERYKEWFDNKWRIYLPLILDKSDIQHDVEEALEDNGYYVVDYHKNKAGKNGDDRPYNIGKLLNRFKKDLVTPYAKDKDVITEGEHMVVISRHPYDIVGMTTDRGWNSCMDIRGGINSHYIMRDIKLGTLVAYVIEKDDTNINRPWNRLLLKKFISSESDSQILSTDDKVYGAKEVMGFRDTVENWLNMKQGDVTETHYLNDGLYPDGKSKVEPTDKVLNKLRRRYDTYKHKGYYIIKNSEKLSGMADKDGNIIVEPQYGKIVPYGNYAVVSDKGRWYEGIIKCATGEVIADVEYDGVYCLSENEDLYTLQEHEFSQKLFHKGNIIGTYSKSYPIHGYLALQKEEEWGLLNLSSENFLQEVLPFEYYEITDFGYSMIKLTKKDTNKFVHGLFKKGKIILECEYDEFKYLTEYSYKIRKDDKWGVLFVNSYNVISTPVIYDNVERYEYDKIATFKDDKKSIYDYEGVLIVSNIPNDVKQTEPLDNGLIRIANDKFYGVSTKDGDILIEMKYTYLSCLEDYIAVGLNNKYGLYDNNGKLVIPALYTNFNVKYNYIIVYDNNMQGVYDNTGKVIYDIIFNDTQIKSNDTIELICDEKKFKVIMDVNGITEKPLDE